MRAMRRLYFVSARQRMIFGRTTANKISRFVDEIPEEHILKTLGKSYGYRSASATSGEFARKSYPQHTSHPIAPPAASSSYAPSAAKKSSSGLPKQPEATAYSVGDRVRHKAFGKGVIEKMTPMGGDYFVEISFETVGIKKLMMKAAKIYLTKE